MIAAYVVGLPVEGQVGTMLRPRLLHWEGGTAEQLSALVGGDASVFWGGRELAPHEDAPDGSVAMPPVV